MACPFFRPLSVAALSVCGPPPRLPLGSYCSGVCTAVPGLLEPSADDLRSKCNRGYARDACAHFPPAAEADAFRFSPAREQGGGLEIHYVVERDHHPLRHGFLQYDSHGCVQCESSDPALIAQARMFAQSYLARKAS